VSDPFVHLHVASGYSLRYGASHPTALVERAVDHGMDALALTDRDGVYGAVRFARAAAAAGIRPLFGVDLALAPAAPATLAPGRRRRWHRGGAFVDPRLPRVTVLARGGAGWTSVCRLVTATHLGGDRGRPVTTVDLVGAHADGLVVLLGPGSPLGRALAGRRPDLARAEIDRWRRAVPDGHLVVEVASHRSAGEDELAARLLGFAAAQGLPAVLTNAVRYADRFDAPVADVLDAARRLVALDPRHVDGRTGQAALKSGKEMADLADDVARLAGVGDAGRRRLLAATRSLADSCAVDPHAALGLGELHLPEPDPGVDADEQLRRRCVAGLDRRRLARSAAAADRLAQELEVIRGLGFAGYFRTVADVVDLVRGMGIRCAARGSGAGSLVTYLLGISDVDPLEHGLVLERFVSPLRRQLPDIDLDVESARRTEVYEAILARFGADRCACVSMMDTYRARHAIRDVGGALGLPPGEVDTIAKSFPHIRANQLRAALRELPELRASGLSAGQLGLLLDLAERLDGLPRHIAVHPCGVLLSDRTLLDRTPVEASWLGFPMSQFDKEDVEDLGLLKLDVLGVRMQSAIAYAIAEVRRVDGVHVDIDTVPRDDPATFQLIRSTRTLGCFQIESPGQRELVGKFAPETFADIIIDISLFRPGPVKSDMVTPFLLARQGWREPEYLHPDLVPVLQQTCGVVVFHEQVLGLIHVLTGCSLAEADEARRALGDPTGQPEVQVWFIPTALRRGYDLATVERAWRVLTSFASFGFCKAHAAAFAVPTYQSAWLKAHHPAAFFAGVLTHDPGMYPKRLILDDARQFGIAILPLDVNRSEPDYRVEPVGVDDEPPPAILGGPPRMPGPDRPDARRYGLRLALADVAGISAAEVAAIVAGRPYATLADFWYRANVSRPVVERFVVTGAFDSLYGINATAPVRRRDRVTRRDLLLQVAELDAARRAGVRAAGRRRSVVDSRPAAAAVADDDVRSRSARQSQAPAAVTAAPVQLALDLGRPDGCVVSGLPEMTRAEQVASELEVLGLDASAHVLDLYRAFLDVLDVVRSRDLLRSRSRASVLVAGVKVATQTPPVRSGRRVVFVTLDDGTGPVDATFFEDAQAGSAATLFHSWLLVIHGTVRRTGPRGVSIQADRCWDLTELYRCWAEGGPDALADAMRRPAAVTDASVHGAADSRSTRPVVPRPPARRGPSPFSDVVPAGVRVAPGPGRRPSRKLWHASPGSSGQ
jgi:error-prone DNA polymerase